MIIDFAKHLREFRERASLTQIEMAKKLNMTQSHVSKYETGRKVIDLETWIRWAKVTRCEADAAVIMFGADIFNQASQLVSLMPAISKTLIDLTQLFS